MKTLLVNLARMGDLVQITPAALGMKTERGAHVTLLAPMKYAEFARRLEGIDEVIPFDEEKWFRNGTAHEDLVHKPSFRAEVLQPLNELGFSLVVNLTHDQFSTALVGEIEAGKVLGRHGQKGAIQVSGGWFRYFYSVLNHRLLNPFNLVDLYRRGVGIRGHYHVSMRPYTRDLERVDQLIGDRRGDHLVLLHPGANHPYRRWPVARYAELAEQLAETGADVRVLTGPGERELGEELVAMASGSAKLLDEAIPVELLPALMKRMDLVVTNDTGPLHIAASVGTATVSIFLAMARPQDTAPYLREQLILESTHAEHPASEHPDTPLSGCSRAVPVEAVYKAASAQLENKEASSVDWPGQGEYRVLEAGVNDQNDLHPVEIFNATGRDLDGQSEMMRHVWLSMLDSTYENDEESSETVFLNGEQTSILQQARQLGDAILGRLQGNDVTDGAGRSLTIRDLEALWLELEQVDDFTAALMLPHRLERETLYARGIEVVKQEYGARFEQWKRAIGQLVVHRTGEAVA